MSRALWSTSTEALTSTPKAARVAEAGGTVILSKTYLGPEAGYIVLFLDTEGNKIGLQTMG